MNEMNSKYCQHNTMKKHWSGSNKEVIRLRHQSFANRKLCIITFQKILNTRKNIGLVCLRPVKRAKMAFTVKVQCKDTSEDVLNIIYIVRVHVASYQF